MKPRHSWVLLSEEKYPLSKEVDGRLYFHIKDKTATDVALLALARRHPARIARQDLVDIVKRNGFSPTATHAWR